MPCHGVVGGMNIYRGLAYCISIYNREKISKNGHTLVFQRFTVLLMILGLFILFVDTKVTL